MKKNQYKDGERDGYWEHNYKNGTIRYKGYFKDGKHGYWEEYYFNGNICYKGNYKNGKPHGLWRYYRLYGGGLWSMGYQKNGKRIGYWEKCHNQRRNIKQFYI